MIVLTIADVECVLDRYPPLYERGFPAFKEIAKIISCIQAWFNDTSHVIPEYVRENIE